MESDIQPIENVLDLKLSSIEFDRLRINEVLGMRDALPSAVQTFVTLDFLNHNTQHTDMQAGYQPEFETIFSFKNTVDDFYIKYLEKNCIVAEIFTVTTQGNKISKKIGVA